MTARKGGNGSAAGPRGPKRRLQWSLGLLVAFLLVAYGVNHFIHTPFGRGLVFSAYGTSLVRPDETTWLVEQIGIEIDGEISERSRNWVEVERAFYWVVMNIAYAPDEDGTAVEFVGVKWVLYGNDRMSSPKETLLTRRGDCEDQAILLVSILRQAGVGADNVYVVLGGFSTENSTYGHSWATIRMANGSWRILDPTALRIVVDETRYCGLIWFNDTTKGG